MQTNELDRTESTEFYEDTGRFNNIVPAEYTGESVYEELPNSDLSGLVDFGMSFQSTTRLKTFIDASYEELNCDKEAFGGTAYEEVGFSSPKIDEEKECGSAEILPSKFLN